MTDVKSDLFNKK